MEKISWHTVEYLHTKKTTDWYWIVGTIAVSIALIAIILNNVIFAILILVSAFTLSLFASRPPAVIPVELSNTGITIYRTYYPFSELESFWIDTDGPYPKILFKSKHFIMHLIVVFIEDVSPEEVHAFLLKRLREEKHSEPFLEKLLLYFGF